VTEGGISQLIMQLIPYPRNEGSYVVRNNVNHDIVQISNRNDSNWIAPW